MAIVSDHGFEATSRVLNVSAFLAAQQLPPANVEAKSGYASTSDETVVHAFTRAHGEPDSCIGREIPRAEIDRFLPASPAVLRIFEPALGCLFRAGKPGDELISKAPEAGTHGHWPTRYRASFVLSGPGIPKRRIAGFDMREVAGRWAQILGLRWP